MSNAPHMELDEIDKLLTLAMKTTPSVSSALSDCQVAERKVTGSVREKLFPIRSGLANDVSMDTMTISVALE